MEQAFTWEGQPGEAVLRMPREAVRGATVALHGASDGRARQPLFDHLGKVLDLLGVALLTYERRRVEHGGDTPLELQAADAVTAMGVLRAELHCPVGVFGFSQGAWAAALAAGDPVAAFLVVLGCSGVSPAAQMRFYTDELLRRSGFDEHDRTEMRRLRHEFEAYLRRPDRAVAVRDRLAQDLRAASVQPWFRHGYLPPEPPSADVTWSDMDFDPRPSFERVRVPVLAMWGADEECVPPADSRQIWRQSGADVTLVDLPGCGHWPVAGSGEPGYAGSDTDTISADFDAALRAWLTDHVELKSAATGARGPPRA